MDAIKFMTEYQRMCDSQNRCSDCALYRDRQCAEIPARYNKDFSSKLINIVEEWSAAHPLTTRSDLFKKEHPNAATDEDGALLICPSQIDKTIECPKGTDCWQCLTEYWLNEV